MEEVIECNTIQKDNVVNEECISKKANKFYSLTFCQVEERDLQSKIGEAEVKIEKMNQHHFRIMEKIQVMYARRNTDSLEHLKYYYGSFRGLANSKTRILYHLQQELDKLNSPKSACQKRDTNLRSSPHSLHHPILHGTRNLVTERQVLRHIVETQSREAEADVEAKAEDIASCLLESQYNSFYQFIRCFHNCMRYGHWNCGCGARARNWHLLDEIKQLMEEEFRRCYKKQQNTTSFVSKKDIQDRIKLTNEISEELWKELAVLKAHIKHESRHWKQVEMELSSLEKQLAAIRQRKAEAYQCILELKKQEEDMG